ncbi:hypothetical protein VTJ04DRAFT_8282 [Mycothermus thermophilus]|uniref:uncharacterized protein n=1 Tax=Humicola insolens TaxID=85995 RepID=UPI003743BB93
MTSIFRDHDCGVRWDGREWDGAAGWLPCCCTATGRKPQLIIESILNRTLIPVLPSSPSFHASSIEPLLILHQATAIPQPHNPQPAAHRPQPTSSQPAALASSSSSSSSPPLRPCSAALTANIILAPRLRFLALQPLRPVLSGALQLARGEPSHVESGLTRAVNDVHASSLASLASPGPHATLYLVLKTASTSVQRRDNHVVQHGRFPPPAAAESFVFTPRLPTRLRLALGGLQSLYRTACPRPIPPLFCPQPRECGMCATVQTALPSPP